VRVENYSDERAVHLGVLYFRRTERDFPNSVLAVSVTTLAQNYAYSVALLVSLDYFVYHLID